MIGVSVLTLARNRTPHLVNLIEGLRRSENAPLELVVVDMNDAPLALADAGFPIKVVRLPPDATLPLAAARNLACRTAAGDRLLFLDADCIPSRRTLGAVDAALDRVDGLVCPEALYLGPDDARGAWDEAELLRRGQSHAVRSFPAHGLRFEANPGLFWSLAFGVRRTTFEALGGFDETFTGYGGEDTDLGFKARAVGVPLVFIADARVFHQHHPVSDPPVEHLSDIVRNAERFRAKWGRWPMEGWLRAFEAMGAISVRGDRLVVTERKPAFAGET